MSSGDYITCLLGGPKTLSLNDEQLTWKLSITCGQHCRLYYIVTSNNDNWKLHCAICSIRRCCLSLCSFYCSPFSVGCFCFPCRVFSCSLFALCLSHPSSTLLHHARALTLSDTAWSRSLPRFSKHINLSYISIRSALACSACDSNCVFMSERGGSSGGGKGGIH